MGFKDRVRRKAYKSRKEAKVDAEERTIAGIEHALGRAKTDEERERLQADLAAAQERLAEWEAFEEAPDEGGE